jgi:hypothetical protein
LTRKQYPSIILPSYGIYGDVYQTEEQMDYSHALTALTRVRDQFEELFIQLGDDTSKHICDPQAVLCPRRCPAQLAILICYWIEEAIGKNALTASDEKPVWWKGWSSHTSLLTQSLEASSVVTNELGLHMLNEACIYLSRCLMSGYDTTIRWDMSRVGTVDIETMLTRIVEHAHTHLAVAKIAAKIKFYGGKFHEDWASTNS